MDKQFIQVITQVTYEVDKNGKKTFRNEKPLLAISNKDEAIETIEDWNEKETKIWELYEGKYHLEFEYKLTEIAFY